jgi:Na+/melibiose symporter-like transporter
MTDTKPYWRQLWGLVALLSTIALGWMAYNYYQAKILTNLGFGEIAATLAIFQGALGAVVEPAVGILSDRLSAKIGSRLPFIAAGVTVAGVTFIALSQIMRFDLPPQIRWIVPGFMTLWLAAAIVVRGPGIALLRQMAPLDLPLANGILTMSLGLIGATGPIFGNLLQSVSPDVAFIAGGGLLFVGLGLLYGSGVGNLPSLGEVDRGTTVKTWYWVRIFLVGWSGGYAVNLLLRLVPRYLQLGLPHLSVGTIAATILFIGALGALPWERVVRQIGTKKSIIYSLVMMAVTIVFSIQFSWLSPLFLLTGGAAIGWLTIAQIPWILGEVSPDRAGFSTGLYFGGLNLAGAIVSTHLTDRISISVGVFIAAIIAILAIKVDLSKYVIRSIE